MNDGVVGVGRIESPRRRVSLSAASEVRTLRRVSPANTPRASPNLTPRQSTLPLSRLERHESAQSAVFSAWPFSHNGPSKHPPRDLRQPPPHLSRLRALFAPLDLVLAHVKDLPMQREFAMRRGRGRDGYGRCERRRGRCFGFLGVFPLAFLIVFLIFAILAVRLGRLGLLGLADVIVRNDLFDIVRRWAGLRRGRDERCAAVSSSARAAMPLSWTPTSHCGQLGPACQMIEVQIGDTYVSVRWLSQVYKKSSVLSVLSTTSVGRLQM